MKSCPVAAAKQRARTRVRAQRAAMSAAARAQASAAICQRLLQLPELANNEPVAAFAPGNQEVDIGPLLARWISGGRSVLLPRVVRGTRKMSWHKILDLQADLDTGYAGILEPIPNIAESNPASAACILIPSVAVDERGNRIGSGGGFYDTNSPRIERVFVIAPVFSCQLLAACPAQEHDLRIDAIVTEKRTCRCR